MSNSVLMPYENLGVQGFKYTPLTLEEKKELTGKNFYRLLAIALGGLLNMRLPKIKRLTVIRIELKGSLNTLLKIGLRRS